MYSVRSSWSAALHDNNAIRLVANGSRRAFSRSAVSHKRALPVFLEASSPQLSSLLTTTNAKVLLPRHFTKEQAQLVFKPANRARIEAEPLEITIGDVTLTLEHIDVNKDIPSYKAVFRDVIRSSKSPEDWENVLRLMEGFRNAGIPLKIDMKENVVRSLSKAGMSHLILKALQRPEHTGLTMTEWGTVRQILIAVRHKATQADWEKEDLKKALKMAELVVEMMEKKPHQTKQDDFRMHPVVVALPLEMASELAYRHDGEIEKVKKYAARLMGVLQDDKTINDMITRLENRASSREADFPTTYAQVVARKEISFDMVSLIPVWNGLSTARTMLDEEMPMADLAERIQRRIREALRKGETQLDALARRGATSLEKDDELTWSALPKKWIKQCEDAEEE